jgi:hypothetical protein
LQKQCISIGHFGRKHTAETKLIIKLKTIGHKRNLGNNHSEETKQKMRLVKIGYIPWNKGLKMKKRAITN